MQKIFNILFSGLFLSSASLLAQSQDHPCACKDCKCSIQSTCGCLQNKTCTCSEHGLHAHCHGINQPR